MPYEPNTWANGDVITATKLNNIEQGVSSVSSNYTPTTWANGDVITATKLNNIEQGIANAGGGSSGYTLAHVVIDGTADEFGGPNVQVPHMDAESLTAVSVDLYDYSTTEVDVPVLANTTTQLYINNLPVKSVTGDVTTEDSIHFFISGDCTIVLGNPS